MDGPRPRTCESSGLSRFGRWVGRRLAASRALHLLWVVCAAASTIGCGGEEIRPNIILVSIDSLRAANLGCYGYPRDTSPFMDRMASEGVQFENAISTTSWTLPAHAAMFTGLYDTTHGLDDDDHRLTDGVLTLAELLKQQGYYTAGFFGGPFLHPTFGLNQGFEVYRSCMTAVPDTASAGDVRIGIRLPHSPSHTDVTGPRTVREISDWTRNGVTRPYFLFLHMWDVHYDYLPPTEYVERFDPGYVGEMTGEDFTTNPNITPQMPRRDFEHLVALYDGEIRFTDDNLHLIFEQLRQHGLLQDTLTVITADHGEEFFEHGRMGHGWTLFDEVIRVPLIVHWPGRLQPGRHEEQVRLIDIFPTLAAAAGYDGRLDVQGRDLGPLLRGWSLPPVTAMSELLVGGQTMRALRNNERKLLQARQDIPGALFDLEVDPQERSPLLPNSDREAERREAEALLSIELASSRELRARLGLEHSEPIELSDELRERLEALGYLDK